jgi:hypothetical protein
VDAIIADLVNESATLVQLKWHDVVGHSPQERESRRRNLLKANEWVSRVSEWMQGKSGGKVCGMLGLDDRFGRKPLSLLVLTRYMMRFTGNAILDSRASWISWPEFLRLKSEASEAGDVLAIVNASYRGGGTAADLSFSERHFQIGSLEVTVRPFVD